MKEWHGVTLRGVTCRGAWRVVLDVLASSECRCEDSCHGPKPLEWRQWQYLRHLWRARHRQHSSMPHTLRALGHLSPMCQPSERTVSSDGSLMTRKLIYSVTCHSSHSFLWICFDWVVTAHVHNYWSHVAGGKKKVWVKTINNQL